MAPAEHTIEIPQEELEPLWWPECCIYEVPECLRKGNPVAYTPQLISIGPLHHNTEKLEPMEKQKKLYYHYFQKRLPNSQQKALEAYESFIRSKENHIRKCYSNTKKCDILGDMFVKMILYDSVFIMELFLRKSSPNESDREQDLLFSKPWIAGGILQDLILLENQLPMFVLVELYDKVIPSYDKHRSFHKIACDYFRVLDASFHRVLELSEESFKPYEQSKHFVDLIRHCCLPRDPKFLEKRIRRSGDLKTARKLKDVGISFQKIKLRPLLEVSFIRKFPCLSTIPTGVFKSRLQIPQLRVDDGTERLLRNLIALEQCHYPKEDYICNYVDLMDSLIDTKEDVDFLIEKQVIVKNVGSDEEVATMLNDLCKEVHVSSSYYADIMDKLNDHYNNKFNHIMAKLKSVYFSDLWRSSATVVGLAVFFFSVFNTVRAFIKGF